jgi:hypothetical protein
MTSSRGSAVVITSIIFAVLAVLSVVTRLVARVGYLKNGGRDDIAISVALVSQGVGFKKQQI